jgi:F-type H+-transporting ATPase subunit b
VSLTLGTMIVQLIIFFILMFLVKKYALAPLLATMKKRQDYIDQQITAAENNRAEAEKLLKEQQELLQKARLEAKELIEEAKKQKEREAERIIKEAQERAERMIQEATMEIQREKEKALASLRDEVGQLAVALTAKLIGKELDKDGQSQLVSQYLEQVGRLQ